MSLEANDLWQRGIKSLESAKLLLPSDPDSSSSCSYYAAFYAVSALFAVKGQTFKKHSSVETALHRELVKTGRWPVELGEMYSLLREMRAVGDYGGGTHISVGEAETAVARAARILEAARKEHPDIFTGI
ncbi:MAG: HEPN domain-containing protein [Nitrospinae bacterium]|nr:HEPN domain-containing protein [Nitrospinota bacterium]